MWKSKLPDPDMQAVPRALERAAQRAREIARQTGTPLVIVRDGVLVEEWVDDPPAGSRRSGRQDAGAPLDDEPPPENLRSELDDPEMQAAPRAREIARQTGTPLVIVRDGVLVEEWITDEDEEPR